jgi:hypothetical protein
MKFTFASSLLATAEAVSELFLSFKPDTEKRISVACQSLFVKAF